MNFATKRLVEDGVFSTTIEFTSYGTAQIPEKQEESIFADLGNPVINLSYLTFSGDFKVDKDARVVPATPASTDSLGHVTKSPDGDNISIIVNGQPQEIAPGFTVSYSVDSSMIADSELGKIINTPLLLAEARCVLFEQTVKTALKKIVEAKRGQATRFEATEVPVYSV